MVGNEAEQAIRPEAVGLVLIQRGWRQGSLFEATSTIMSWLTLNNNQEEQGSSPNTVSLDKWLLCHEALSAEDVLIVTSQTCDIQRSSKDEPYVESRQAVGVRVGIGADKSAMGAINRPLRLVYNQFIYFVSSHSVAIGR